MVPRSYIDLLVLSSKWMNMSRVKILTEKVIDSAQWRLARKLSVINELHLGGSTRHPSSCVQCPGKFEGLIEYFPYLKDVGITHVEPLPGPVLTMMWQSTTALVGNF
jgi:pullulanase/glycogen debranching enzyme